MDLITLLDIVGCLPSETYARKGHHSEFQFFAELSVPQQAAGVIGTLNCCAFLYHSGILSTTLSFLDLKDTILFYKVSILCVCMSVYISIIFASTLCMCLTSFTYYICSRTVSLSF